jgi:hypothetical protein
MIKEEKVLVKINNKNYGYFKSLGYEKTDDQILIKIIDLSKGSKIKITAICEICFSENIIMYSKYLINKKRNNKGYYSCFNCKNIEKEKTCISKYGVKSYSMTDEYKKSESIKWKGIQKGSEKGKKTMIEKYGVDSFFKTEQMKEMNRKWMSSNEFKLKSKKSMMDRYGVDHFSKSDLFKLKIESIKNIIITKTKETLITKYGVDWISKINFVKEGKKINKNKIESKRIQTCIEKYGVDNISKLQYIQDKIRKTNEINGNCIPIEMINDWDNYKRVVRNISNKNKKLLYENWNGYDYYDNEFIKGYQSYSHVHRFYPTIDHKVSKYYGFINDIPAEEISDISNLCITKRFINSIKNKMIESEFI